MTLFAKAYSEQAYDSWEVAAPDERRRVRAERLDAIIGFARTSSPFYAGRLDDYAPGADHPLASVPVMTPAELRAHVPPQGDALLTVHDGNYTVFQSGGTTGMPKTTLFSHHELDLLDFANARGFYAVGLRPEDRVANQFAVGGLYMTFIHINRMLQQYGCQNFPFSNHVDVGLVRTMVDLFGINCFAGISSVVLDTLRQFPLDQGLKIEKVFFGGEHLYEADDRELRERLGVTTIAAPGYGTVDTWYIGYQCSRCPRGVFHAHDDQTFIEIVDEDTGRHCDDGEPGMLYATPFVRRLTPIVRYRVGDRARWLGEPCPCGRVTPRFVLLGRGDDTLRIGYDSVDYEFVQQTVEKVSARREPSSGALSGVVQIEKTRREGRDQLVVRVETTGFEADQPEVNRALTEALLASRPTLAELVRKGAVWPVRVDLVQPGSLARNPRTGKLIRVIDARGDD